MNKIMQYKVSILNSKVLAKTMENYKINNKNNKQGINKYISGLVEETYGPPSHPLDYATYFIPITQRYFLLTSLVDSI